MHGKKSPSTELAPQCKKTEKRLLRLISREGAFAVEESEYVIFSSDRQHRFDAFVVQSCHKRTLIEIHDKKMVLTDTGKSYLQRLLHPEEPFLAQNIEARSEIRSIQNSNQPIRVNIAESPIYRLYTRKNSEGKTWLNDKEFQAGERLRSDFEKAQLQPRVSANWASSVSQGGSNVNGSADLSDFSIDARKRIEKAIAAIGKDLSGTALDICCFLKGLEQVERERSWPPRSAKLMLRTALRELAGHYGMLQTNNSRKTEQWGADDFRPFL